jgi:hypothetical protein
MNEVDEWDKRWEFSMNYKRGSVLTGYSWLKFHYSVYVSSDDTSSMRFYGQFVYIKSWWLGYN